MKKSRKRVQCINEKKRNIIKKENGITLISLVVTIIILIVLAGIAINITVGDNGIFTKAKEAKKQQEIVQITEKLELEKANLKLENYENRLTVESYLEWLQKKGIINEENIKETGNDISKIIEIDEKYLYLIKQSDNGNIDVEYIAETGEILPQKGKIDIVSITTNSIKIKVRSSSIKNLEYKYYIKNESNDEKYELKETNNSNEYQYTNLLQNNKYSVMVEIQSQYIKETLEKAVETDKIQELQEADIEFNYSSTIWTSEPIIVTANKKSTISSQYKLQTSKDNENWEETNKQEFKENGNMYVRLWDGINGSNYVVSQISKIDNTAPTNVSLIKNATTNNSITVTASAKDMQSGITKIELSKDGGKTYSVYKMVGQIIDTENGYRRGSNTGIGYNKTNLYEGNLLISQHTSEYTYKNGGFYYFDINQQELEEGKKYEWEVYIKSDNERTIRIGHEQNGIKYGIKLTNNWQKLNHEFIATKVVKFKSFIFYGDGKEGENIYIHSLLLRKLDEDYTSADYNYTFEGLEKGIYQIKARFTNHSGLTSESEILPIIIE